MRGLRVIATVPSAANPTGGGIPWFRRLRDTTALDPDEVAPGFGSFLVARSSGRPVGCGALRCLRDAASMRALGPRVGELKRMYVAPQVRGQGIGKAILARLEAEARALGLARLVLETGTRQTDALAFYSRAGFTEIPAYGEYLASPATSVCLSKLL